MLHFQKLLFQDSQIVNENTTLFFKLHLSYHCEKKMFHLKLIFRKEGIT